MKRSPIRPRRSTPRRRTAPQEAADWWTTATAALWARSHGRCERCGVALGAERVERHHRMRRRDGGDRLANLMLIHGRCHTYITEHPEEARANGWIVSALAGYDPARVSVRIDGLLWLLRDDGGKTPVL